MQRFFDLAVGKRAHAWVLSVYRVTARFPADERFGITNQLRRASASVPTNLAEGAKRRRAPEYARFINIAESSLAEAEYLLTLSRDLEYLSAAAAEELLNEASLIGRMLHGLRRAVERGVSPDD
jgi:four helix bundle protein